MSEDAAHRPGDAAQPEKAYSLAPEPAPARAPTPAAPAPAPGTVVVIRDETALSRPGWLTWQTLTTVGVTTLVTAAVLASVEASRLPRSDSDGWAPRGLVAAFRVVTLGPLSALLGVVALWIASFPLQRRLGNPRLAFGRMLAAVGVFALIVTLGPLILGDHLLAELIQLAIGVLTYLAILWSTFRLSRNNTLLVGAIHVALAGVMFGLIWAAPRLIRGGADPAPDAPLVAPPPQ